MRQGSDSQTRPWVVVNQSQSPQFQALLEELTFRLGQGELVTGMPFRTQSSCLRTVKGPAYCRTSLSRRLQSWLRFFASAAWHLLRGPGPKFLLVTTNPPFLPHLAWLVGKLRATPYILLFWDIYPDHAVRQGWLAGIPGSFIVKIWRWANRQAMRHAAAVITIGRRMAEELQAQAGEVSIDVIPNWADIETIKPIPKENNPFALQHDQGARVTVLYSGNIGKTHGITLLIEAAGFLQGVPNLWFLIIGDGLGLASACTKAELLEIRNITFLPLQPWDQVPLSLATGDIGVVLQEAGTENLSVPSKTYNMMAAGCAIVACTAPNSDLAALIHEHRVGVVVPPDNALQLAQAIRQLAMEPGYLSTVGQRSQAAAVTSFSPSVARQDFERVLLRAMPKDAKRCT